MRIQEKSTKKMCKEETKKLAKEKITNFFIQIFNIIDFNYFQLFEGDLYKLIHLLL